MHPQVVVELLLERKLLAVAEDGCPSRPGRSYPPSLNIQHVAVHELMHNIPEPALRVAHREPGNQSRVTFDRHYLIACRKYPLCISEPNNNPVHPAYEMRRIHPQAEAVPTSRRDEPLEILSLEIGDETSVDLRIHQHFDRRRTSRLGVECPASQRCRADYVYVAEGSVSHVVPRVRISDTGRDPRSLVRSRYLFCLFA